MTMEDCAAVCQKIAWQTRRTLSFRLNAIIEQTFYGLCFPQKIYNHTNIFVSLYSECYQNVRRLLTSIRLLFLITKNLSGWDKTWSCTKVWTHTLPYLLTFWNISRCTRKLFTFSKAKAIHIRTPLNCHNAFTETDSLLITHRDNLT